MAFDLEIDQPDLVTMGKRRRGDQLEPERLQAQEHPGVHQGARMNTEQAHGMSPCKSAADGTLTQSW
jgi:hypothetical protein